MKSKMDDIIGLYIHRLDLKITSLLRSKLEPFQLAPEQHLILMLLQERDGLTQNEIAQELDKDKTNITRMVSSLEKKAFIKRVNSLEDRRFVSVHLTDTGRDLCERIKPILEEVNGQIIEDVSGEELVTLRKILQKIDKNVE